MGTKSETSIIFLNWKKSTF